MTFQKSFLVIWLVIVSLFMMDTALGAPLSCIDLFKNIPIESRSRTPVSSKPPAPAQNKWQMLADNLGLQYVTPLKSEGYRREIIGQRQYLKKDGQPGKTVYFYRYFRPDGSLIRPRLDAEEYQKIRQEFFEHRLDSKWPLVWLAKDQDAHIQMWAKDQNGKRFATYHQDWATGSAATKFNRISELKEVVDQLRRQNRRAIRGLLDGDISQQNVEGLALSLLLSGRIRVGSSKYRDQNGTYGVTTLLKEQVLVQPSDRLFLKYIGKSGNKDPENPVITEIQVIDPLIKKGLFALSQLAPENENLFLFESKKGVPKTLTAIGLNRSLNDLQAQVIKRTDRSKSNAQRISVKDLRTWAANVAAVQELITAGPPPTEPLLQDQIFKTVSQQVALILNNTPAVSRKNYIDPRLLNPDGYQLIWNLAAEHFPQLLLKTKDRNQDSNPAAKNYNPDFEDLLVLFFNSKK